MAKRITTKKEEEKLTPPSSSSENAESEQKLTPPAEPKLESKKEKDYLWKFEYHQPSGRAYFQIMEAGSRYFQPGIKYMPPQPGSKAAKFKEQLLGQETKEYLIPRQAGEDKEIAQTVNMNGYHLELPKNIYLILPVQIVEFIKDSIEKTDIALKPRELMSY